MTTKEKLLNIKSILDTINDDEGAFLFAAFDLEDKELGGVSCVRGDGVQLSALVARLINHGIPIDVLADIAKSKK